LTQSFQRDRFTWLAYLFLGFYSYFLNGLGPITPLLKEELKLSYTVSSLHCLTSTENGAQWPSSRRM
jgi:hypothetical protein